jgi:hypothetical protein
LPVELILRDVTVAQALHKPVRAVPPTDMQILDQERGNDQPDPIVHPALGLQLTHACVDERVTGIALFPGREPLGGCCGAVWIIGRHLGEFRADRLAHRIRPVKKHVGEEVTPGDLAGECRGPF